MLKYSQQKKEQKNKRRNKIILQSTLETTVVLQRNKEQLQMRWQTTRDKLDQDIGK